MPFNQKMTFPTSLKLRQTLGGLVLAPTPVVEIVKLHRVTQRFEDRVITSQASFVHRLPTRGRVRRGRGSGKAHPAILGVHELRSIWQTEASDQPARPSLGHREWLPLITTVSLCKDNQR
jgi:hypothetical protein